MPIGSKILDGNFNLFYRKGWAYLIIYPPHEAGKPVYPEEIESRMRMLGVPSVPAKTLRELIQTASGKAEPLVQWPDGYRLASEINVTVAEDDITASLSINTPKKSAAPPTI